MRALAKLALLIAAVSVPHQGVCLKRDEAGLWNEWPAGREDYEPSCEVPPGFVPVNSLVTRMERMSLNERFRSDDGSVELGIAAMYVRDLPPTVGARSIPLPLLPGERIVKREPLWKTVNVQGNAFKHYEEAITIAGPQNAYTRYFRVEISTGTLPGAFSILWEFKVADEKARRAFQQTYRSFKDRVSLGED